METMDDFREELEASFKKIRVGDVVTGTVIDVTEDQVIVDLKTYADGVIRKEDLSEDPDFNMQEAVHPGDEITATVMATNDGEGNMVLSKKEANAVLAWDKLKKLIRLSMKIIGFIGAAALMISLAVTEPLVAIFARPDNPVYGLAVTGNRICSSALVFIGFNVFASGMFTALSNGLVSAVLAFSRSFVFMVAAMLILPAILGVTGAWLATPAAEAAAFLLSAVMFIKYRRKYQY